MRLECAPSKPLVVCLTSSENFLRVYIIAIDFIEDTIEDANFIAK